MVEPVSLLPVKTQGHQSRGVGRRQDVSAGKSLQTRQTNPKCEAKHGQAETGQILRSRPKGGRKYQNQLSKHTKTV